ncbi:MAG: hypothetical protein WCP57_03880 [Bacteroidota bacterium]
MKTKGILFLLMLSILLATVACNKQNEKHLLKIDLQSDFVQNRAKIYIDDQLEVDSLVSTNYTIGLAQSFDFNLSRQTHQVQILIDNTQEIRFAIKLNKDQYIGITYDSTSHILRRNISDKPFFYD